MSSQPFQVSFDLSVVPSASEVVAASYAAEAALLQPSLTTAVPGAPAVPAIEDTVTLSVEAVRSAASSNVIAFTTQAPNSVAAQEKAQATFHSEYPLQYLLDVGYSSSEIATLYGLPTEVSRTGATLHTFDTAA